MKSNSPLNVPKTRLVTGLCLIALIMHKSLSLSEIVSLTGVSIPLTLNALQALVDLHLIHFDLEHEKYLLLNESEALKYLVQINFIEKKASKDALLGM